LKDKINELSIDTLLNGPYDTLNCFLEIHPGAGGTEACDWASMLLRMYTRFCEKNNYQYEVISTEDGEEAGLKEVTILIKGYYPYGYFKGETGVHRLVRISPFDANKRRHTSFASVLVTPEFNKNIDIEIKESDLKIDVYHSSGAGGQSVNTSNSAVRITHIPTKTVVTCQVERSQMMNKERAMEMLKSKLYQLELSKQNAALDSVKGSITSINFGSQIRSYVLEPYTMVKDTRSNYETSEAFKVLDGDIKELMESTLKTK
jgi:peptide chain release factor 2